MIKNLKKKGTERLETRRSGVEACETTVDMGVTIFVCVLAVPPIKGWVCPSLNSGLGHATVANRTTVKGCKNRL